MLVPRKSSEDYRVQAPRHQFFVEFALFVGELLTYYNAMAEKINGFYQGKSTCRRASKRTDESAALESLELAS